MRHPITKTKFQRPVKQNAFAQAPKHYDREVELPKLIGLWPSELRDKSAGSSAKIVALLKKALRAERRLGRTGHWSYNLTRHLALSEALKAEQLRASHSDKPTPCKMPPAASTLGAKFNLHAIGGRLVFNQSSEAHLKAD